MRDIMSKSKTGLVDDPNTAIGRTENEKKKLLALVTDDICAAILETSFVRMLRKEKVQSEMLATVGPLELWSNDFDNRIDFSNYRSRLVCPHDHIIVVPIVLMSCFYCFSTLNVELKYIKVLTDSMISYIAYIILDEMFGNGMLQN